MDQSWATFSSCWQMQDILIWLPSSSSFQVFKWWPHHADGEKYSIPPVETRTRHKFIWPWTRLTAHKTGSEMKRFEFNCRSCGLCAISPRMNDCQLPRVPLASTSLRPVLDNWNQQEHDLLRNTVPTGYSALGYRAFSTNACEFQRNVATCFLKIWAVGGKFEVVQNFYRQKS